jgi:hypothetical protein
MEASGLKSGFLYRETVNTDFCILAPISEIKTFRRSYEVLS